MPPDPTRSFTASPNALFATHVARTARLSPGFVRLTLTGPDLDRFAPYGLDQRVKILLGGPCPELAPGLPEREWRRVWRAVPEDRRPVLRSYTAYEVRPATREIDLDFYVHDPAGPASDWALGAAPGDPLLVSGPDVTAGRPAHGIQWEPGPDVRRVLVAGDETAYPAIRGILAALPRSVRADVLLEAGDPADAATLDDVTHGPGRSAHVVLRAGAPGGRDQGLPAGSSSTVPLVDPRSSTSSPASAGQNARCVEDTDCVGSSIVTRCAHVSSPGTGRRPIRPAPVTTTRSPVSTTSWSPVAGPAASGPAAQRPTWVCSRSPRPGTVASGRSSGVSRSGAGAATAEAAATGAAGAAAGTA